MSWAGALPKKFWSSPLNIQKRTIKSDPERTGSKHLKNHEGREEHKE
jgi:hypothetical protein